MKRTTYRYLRGAFAVMTIILMGVMAACGGGKNAEQRLRLAGSSTIQPIAEKCARSFEANHPGVRVDVEGGGSSVGASSLLSGISDIGNLSRALKQGELEAGLVPTTIGYDGVALIVHSSNPVISLNDAQVVGIYSGIIRNWADVGGSDKPIVVINKEEGRATLEVFEKHFGLKGHFREDAIIIGPNGQAIESVAGNEQAIAYVSIGSAKRAVAQGTQIKRLELDGVPAEVETVRSGTYPLLRPLTMATKGEPAGLAAEFIEFVLSEAGQAIAAEEDFVTVN